MKNVFSLSALLLSLVSNVFSAEVNVSNYQLKFKSNNFKTISGDLGFNKKVTRESFLNEIEAEVEKNNGQGFNFDSAQLKEYCLQESPDRVNRIVLVISVEMGWEYEVVFYKKNKNEWDFEKVIPVFSKYEKPQIYLQSFKDKNLMVMISSGGGSSFEESSKEVYYLTSDKIKKVLEFPNFGFNYNNFEQQVGYRYKSSQPEIKNTNGIDSLEIPFQEEYYAGGDCSVSIMGKSELVITSVNSRLKYFWNDDQEKFIADQRNPVPFNSWDASEFLKHFLRKLKQVASGNDETKKKWLKCFCQFPDVQQQDPEEVTEIMAIMGKK